jgi:U3 small nucleolar RNA-associated protein 12
VQAWEARQRVGGGSDGAPVLVPNMLLLGLDEGAYLLRAISSVRATELEQALLLLPFESAATLLERLLPLVPSAPPAELMARCVLFVLKIHHKRIASSRGMLRLVSDLDESLRIRLEQEHAVCGYNLAAMRTMRRTMELGDEAKFFARALEDKAGQSEGRPTTSELRRKTAAQASATRGSKRKKQT